MTWSISATGNSIYDNDENVRLFLTGNKIETTSLVVGSLNGFNDVEMNQLEKKSKRTTTIPVDDRKRSDLERIVNEVFLQGAQDRVAVVVCGRAELARELRKAVGICVKSGRDVCMVS